MSLRIAARKALLRTLGAVIYMICGAFIFQKIENKKTKFSNETRFDDLIASLSAKFNTTEDQAHMVVSEVQKALLMNPGCHLPVDWDYRYSLIFTFSVVTTIGWGHLVPRTVPGRVLCILYAIFGIPLFAAMMKSWGELIHGVIELVIDSVEQRILKILRPRKMHMKCFVVTVVLMIISVLSGGLFFSRAKGWSYLNGVYYYFISVSTIGFGDLTFIEGKDQRKDNVLVSTLMTIHMFLGLAVMSSIVVAMCRIFSIAKSQTLSFSRRVPRLERHTFAQYSENGKTITDDDREQ